MDFQPPASPLDPQQQQQQQLVDMESMWTEESAAAALAAEQGIAAAAGMADDVFQLPHFLLPNPPPFAGTGSPAHVMTEEQLETLRRQISVYATICQQLVEMHKATISHQHTYNGLVLGHQSPAIQDHHSSPMLLGIHHKPTSRQRWTPSQNQLRILERLFKQGNGTPNRQRIKEITSELSQHGQISETNVYNWFQNRKARAKRKQRHNNAGAGGGGGGATASTTTTTSSQHKDAESEVDTDGDHSPEEKRSKMSSNSQHFDIDQSNTTTEIIGTRYAVVMLNGKAWKVKPGRINVRSTFGDAAVLLDSRGHVVATGEQGLTLDPLQPGGSYTVAG